VAVSADGRIAVVCHNTSRNVAIVDLVTQTVRSYVDVGERPLGAAITPEGAYAVVCAADANDVVIIDLSTDTVVKTLYIYRRPTRVRISPDGQYAYVLNMAGGDKISFIHLDGANSSIVAQVNSGETGVAYGYPYSEFSDIELSHDGSILAVCASFDDRLNLFDTATQAQVASVPVGDFPIRVGFAPDDSGAYVANAFGDNVSVVEVDGTNSSWVADVGPTDMPITVDVDAAGTYAYVGNVGSSAGIRVIDTSTNTIVRTLAFAEGGARDSYLSWTDGQLYVASTASELVRIAATGPTSAIVDATPLSSSTSDMAFDNGMGLAVVALPGPDGVDLVQFGCVADLDGDRDIDLGDLTQLLAHYGMTSGASREDGDLDGDGDVDLTDLTTLLAVYGTTCG
jgi:DNA-binding beta-propeller fold protein YncE